MKKDEPKPMSEWLKRITPDQNLNSLGELILTKLTSVGKRWFASRTIQPVGQLARYNSETGKWVLGDGRDFRVVHSTASLGANTLTNSGEGVMRVHYAAMENITRAYTPVLTGTIGGTAVTYLWQMAAAAAALTRQSVCLGGSGLSSATIYSCMMGPIDLQPGGSLTMTDAAFVAADDMDYVWLYEVL